MDFSTFIASDCDVCKESINFAEDQVICSSCKTKFHETCVKKNDNMTTWVCTVCTERKQDALQVPSAPRSVRSRNVSRGNSSKSTSSSKAKAILDALEEEKLLLEAQAKEKERLLNETHKQQRLLLKKKQEAIQDIASSKGGSSRRSVLSVPSVGSREKVKKWMDTELKEEPVDTKTSAPIVDQSLTKPLNATSDIRLANATAPRVDPTTTNQNVTSTAREPRLFANSTFKDQGDGRLLKQTSNSHPPIQFHEGLGNEEHVPDHTTSIVTTYRLSQEQVAARHVVKDLPKFDGNPRRWPRFISSFKRSTQVCGFTHLENLERLTASLSDAAFTAVESSLTLEENVPRIIETLEMLFGKPEFIITSLIEEMEKSSPPTEDSIDSIIRYALEIENITVTMKLAKLSDQLWNPIMFSQMVDRLPCNLKREWATFRFGNPKCNIEVFGLWLKQKAMEYSTILVKPPSFNSAHSTSKSRTKHTIHVHHEDSDIMRCIICGKKCKDVENCDRFINMNLTDKWQAVKKHHLCRTCLTNHRVKMCPKDNLCGIDNCEYRHHKLLHKTAENQNENIHNIHLHRSESKTFFKILPVRLWNGKNSITVFAMLDDGSSITIIDDEIARYLELKGEDHPLCLKWTNDVERRDENSKVVKINISPISSGTPEFTLGDVHTIKNLSLPTQTVDVEELGRCYEHLKGIPMKSYESAQPMLLIGLNHSKLMAVKKYRLGNDGEPCAAKTTLGWCIFGCKSKTVSEIFHINKCDCEESLNLRLEDMVRQNYSLDAIGVSNQSVTPRSNDDCRAMAILEDTVKFNGTRYEVGLLWKYDHIKVPNNKHLALRRHSCLEKKIAAEPGLRQIINNIIEDYLMKGYVRKVPQDEVASTSWYLPIFVVRNPNKPNKIRLVWDAAAEIYGVSLNEMLVKGPDLLSSLPGVLLRFREHKVAISGDIKEMFHQIAIRSEDRPFQRFMWKPSEESEMVIYEMNVMTFGASCSPSCSQYIKNLNAEKFKEQYQDATRAIQSNHYVDDWLDSVDSPEDAIKLADEVKYVHGQGGFEIRNWVSNSPIVVQHLNKTKLEEVKNLEIGTNPGTDKILGMFWRTTDDVFTYILKITESNSCLFNGEKTPTKRDVLRILMSIYDPLGLISNILAYPKILIQQIWRSKTSWDEKITEEHHQKWLLWTKYLKGLESLEIPRWIGLKNKGSSFEMHCFVDASEDAYGAVIYFKVFSDSVSKNFLITAKSRVAPLRSLSIPRLELQAAVIGTRLSKFVEENLSDQHKITKRYFWSDSETVMKWLHSDSRRYTQFVSCRIGEILENSSLHEWHWIAGKKNVADMVTKMRICEISSSSEWFQGPSFLNEEVYPTKKLDTRDVEIELRPKHQIHHISNQEEAEFRIAKWTKLRRTYAFVVRYVNNLRLSKNNQPIAIGPLTSDEYTRGQGYLFRKAQMESYSEEYSILQCGGVIRNKHSEIFKDSPFIDELGVLRSRSRIQSSPGISFATKNPILLPRNHRITLMVLQFYHQRYHHHYIATVFNEVKQQFIIPRLRSMLKTIRLLCQECKNRDARPAVPQESELPPARVTPFTLAFTFVGIDFFGPLIVAVGRKNEKRWCMLVTCLTSRAVHIEVAHTLSTDSCILGLRRFMSIRGKPRQIYTDNGTNFKGARREFREMWEKIDQQKLADTFVDPETDWMFIPPASPHMGGAWERMVRSVKTSLKLAYPYKKPNDELLLTMVAEVANLVNNRPLTYVAIEDENEEALTPNHLVLGSSSGVKPLGSFKDDAETLRANWHKAQFFATKFWKRWVNEYLPTLSRRTKWFLPANKEPKVDDVVIILCDEKPGNWPKGKILEVHRGRDGCIRSAKVQTVSGVYTRPVSKLAILDVCARNDGNQEFNTRIPGGAVDTSTNIQSREEPQNENSEATNLSEQQK